MYGMLKTEEKTIYSRDIANDKEKSCYQRIKKVRVTSVQVDTWGFEKGRHEGAQITAARLLLRRSNTFDLSFLFATQLLLSSRKIGAESGPNTPIIRRRADTKIVYEMAYQLNNKPLFFAQPPKKHFGVYLRQMEGMA